MYSYLHNKSGDTQYTDRARRIGFDEFSALRHGDVVIVHTFVLCVMSCKSRDYVGTMKNYCLFKTDKPKRYTIWFGGSKISNRTDCVGCRLKLKYLFFQNVSRIVWYIQRKPTRSFFSKASYFFSCTDSHICTGSKLRNASAIFVRFAFPPNQIVYLFGLSVLFSTFC